ncbi:MAG: NAD-binding protein, partial [Candidatus Binatia bacterium]
GVPAAEAGRMNFMVGGDTDVLANCRETLKILGPVVTHVGAIGSGHTIKAINMLALAASMLSAAELAAFGVYCGHELENIVDTMERSEGASYSTRIHFPRFIIPGNYASGFSFNLMFKDLSIGTALADRREVPLFLEKTTFDLYCAAETSLRGEDNTRIVERILTRTFNKKTSETKSVMAHIPLLARACNIIIGAETICLGTAAGLPAEKIINVISESSGDSYAISHDIATYLRNAGRAPSLSSVAEAAKAVASSVPDGQMKLPLISQTADLCNEAIAKFGDAADCRSLVDLIVQKTKQSSASPMKREIAIGN